MVLVSGGLAAATRDRGRVYPNVWVAGRDLGGMLPEEARRAVAEALPPAEAAVTVRAAEESHRCTLRDLGVSFSVSAAVERAYAVGRSGAFLARLRERVACWRQRTQIEVPLAMDTGAIAKLAQACADRFNREPVNAEAIIEGDKVRVTSGQPGLQVGTEEVPEAVEAWAHHGCAGDLELPVRFTGPAVTADKYRGIDTVLASVSTSLAGSSRNRRHNIALAVAAVDGRLLAPAEVFSYNEVVGPRTEDEGYRTAPILRQGKLVPGTGGGACQLSSTLYQAALRAGLEIVRRTHHSQPAAYCPAGLDAAVVYGSLDLRFRNSRQHPTMLRARVEQGRLVCRILGSGPAPDLELVRQTTSLAPPEPEIIQHPSLAPGERKVEREGQAGLRVRVLRKPKGAPIAEAEVISTDHYQARRGVIRVGPAAGDSAAEAPPAAASP